MKVGGSKLGARSLSLSCLFAGSQWNKTDWFVAPKSRNQTKRKPKHVMGSCFIPRIGLFCSLLEVWTRFIWPLFGRWKSHRSIGLVYCPSICVAVLRFVMRAQPIVMDEVVDVDFGALLRRQYRKQHNKYIYLGSTDLICCVLAMPNMIFWQHLE